MSWVDEQERLTQEARLQAASPDEVYQHLKGAAQKPLHFVKNQSIETLLVERNQPLINLALACYGTSKVVYTALYQHSLEPPRDTADANYKRGLRIGCLSNRSVPAASFAVQYPLRLIGQEELSRLLANGDDLELEALLCNPSVCDQLLEDLYRHKSMFAAIPEERWRTLVYLSRKNERLRSKDDEDDRPDLGYYRIHEAIFHLLEIAPLNWHWLHVLYALLDDLNFEEVPPPKSIDEVLARWDKLEGGEKLNGGYFTSRSLKQEFRCLIASLYGGYSDKTIALQRGPTAKDVTMRCAFYGNARMTEKELRAGYERDLNIFAFAAIKNPELFLTAALRRTFEQDILDVLDENMMRRYLVNFELMKRRSPYLKSFLSPAYREKAAPSKEDARIDAIQTVVTGIDERLNKLGEQLLRATQGLLILGAVVLGAILFFRH